MASAGKMLRQVAKPAAQATERRAMQSLSSMPITSMDIFPMASMAQAASSSKSSWNATSPAWPTPMLYNVLPTTSAPAVATPLMQIKPNLYAKLEGFNAGGSIKDRAVMQCTLGMLKNGKLKPGDTLAVATSGNAGRSLLHVQDMLRKKGIKIEVKIFMPSRYLSRDVPTVIAETGGVETVVGDRDSSFYVSPSKDGEATRFLHGLDGEFMECQQKMSALADEHGWVLLDQHYDVNSLHAHESTAEEIIQQLPSVTDVVCTTGTGGTAAGLRKYLPAHVAVHARPGKPGAIDGITDVRRYSNFCDVDLLKGYTNNFFDAEDSTANQNELKALHSITAGQSSGACYALAKEILKNNPNAHVAFICADGNLSKVE